MLREIRRAGLGLVLLSCAGGAGEQPASGAAGASGMSTTLAGSGSVLGSAGSSTGVAGSVTAGVAGGAGSDVRVSGGTGGAAGASALGGAGGAAGGARCVTSGNELCDDFGSGQIDPARWKQNKPSQSASITVDGEQVGS